MTEWALTGVAIQVMMEMMCCLRGGGRREGAADNSGVGPLPWLWGRKWCLKGEVGRESLFLEPTLLLHREEQSFCMPVRASARWEKECGKEGGKTPGPGNRSGQYRTREGDKVRHCGANDIRKIQRGQMLKRRNKRHPK